MDKIEDEKKLRIKQRGYKERMKAMKKIKEMLRRIGTAGLAAIMLTAQMPVTAFAEEIEEPQAVVVSDDVLPAKVQTEDVLPGEGGGGIIEGTASEESGEDIANTSKTGDEAVQAGETPLTEKDASEKTADEEASDPVEKQEEGVDAQEEQESDKKDADGDKENVEQTASEEEERPAFSESKSIDGVRITVTAAEGVFPEGAVLSVEKVTKEQEKKAEEAVESERDEEKKVAASYTYDIKVLDQDGNELQPADESKVKVSFKLEEVADSNLETNIYHIKEADSDGNVSGEKSGNDKADSEEATEGDGADSDSKVSENTELVAEKLTVETDGDTAIAETDGFSLYTVEFTYDNKQYVLPGDSEVALSEILDTVGLTGEVSAVEVSDESLFSAKKCKTAGDGKTPEEDEDDNPIEDENGAWFVFAHQAFSTEEWMKVTIGGVAYEIVVTDTQSPYGHNGSGTAEDPWQIATAQQWQYFENMVNIHNSTYGDDYYKLTADITVDTNDNSAIFVGETSGSTFGGHFDGDGHTLTFNYSGTLFDCAAPFRYVNGATIENLKVTGSINAGKDCAAGIAGCVEGNTTTTIKNCTSSVTINSNSGYSGGFVGFVKEGKLTLQNCVFNGSMTGSTTQPSGGFVGHNDNGTYTITDCLFNPTKIEVDIYSFVQNSMAGFYRSLTRAYRTYDSTNSSQNQGTKVYTTAPDGQLTQKITAADNNSYWMEGIAEISGIEASYPLTGSMSLPSCTVKFNGGSLTKDTDYTVMVTNNSGIVNSITETGTYTLTVTGKGNYGGSISKTFKVYASIPYIDAAGSEKVGSATRLESAALPDGDWWYVTGETTINSRITISGTKHLILTDGAALNIPKGIRLSSGNTLNIYGQSGNTGKLVINGVENKNAGIGGNQSESCGTLTVNGGDITVTAGNYAAGIGGGMSGNGGTVTINGGKVTAVGKQDGNTVGIGGGGTDGVTDKGGDGGTIIINGGVVSAKTQSSSDGTNSFGMGGGNNCNNKGSVTINWKNVSDSIYASSYNSNVTIAGDFVHKGTSTKATSGNIGGKTIVPAKKITVGSVTGGTLALPDSASNGSYFGIGSTVTLTVTPDSGYKIGSVKCGSTEIEPVEGVYSFEMPANDVTVSAAFSPIPATAPTITTQPVDLDLQNGASSGNVLTVAAEAIADHTLSYQWYSNTANSNEGGSVINGATSASYTVPTGSDGTTYYYCVVTAAHTNGQTAAATSNVAAVTVTSKTDAGVSISDPPPVPLQYLDTLALTGSAQNTGTNGTWTWTSSDPAVLRITPDGAGATIEAKRVGTATITASYESDTTSGSKTLALTVDPIPVTITGLSVSDKEYDGNTTAAVTGTAAIFGKIGNDDVTVTAGTATFADKNVGTDKTVTFSGYALSGTAKDNYTLSAQPASVTASITPKSVTVSGITAQNKEYDGTTDATLVYSGASFGKCGGDDLTVSATSAFESADAGDGKTVTISNLTLGGTDAGNYVLAESGQQTSATANITAKSITGATVTLSATQLEYTGSEQSVSVTGVTLDGKTLTTADYDVSGNTGTEKNTYTVTVTGKGNYKDSATATWAITDKPMTVFAPDVTVTYDGQPHGIIVSVSDPVNGAATIKYGENEGSYTLEASPVITNVSDSPKIVYFKVTADNYAEYTGSATVTINKKPVTVTGITASDKTYDGTTAATIDCTAAIFDGKVESDELTVTADGAFADANAGMGKTVNISNLVLGGAAVGNYKLAESGQQKTARATIATADIPTEQITEPTAKTGLTYTGSAQELIGAGNVAGSIGTMYYAVTATDTAPADNLYTTPIPTATDARTYYVWYKVKGDANHNDVAAAGPLTVDIAKADFTNKTVSGNTKYGLSGTIELKELIAPGGTFGALSITDADSVLEGTPVLTGTVLSYSFKSVSENVGKTATVTIPVSNATNYKDYSITATLNVINCEHPHTELRNIKEATCTEKGCKGDLYCTECNSLLLKGEEIPINPDNHAFVLASVVSSPDSMTGEIRTYRCSRCGKTYTDPLITSPKTDENGNTTESVAVGGVTVEEVTVDKTTGKETVSTRVWVSGLASSYTYTGSAIKPSFKVYSGTTLLKEGTDYSVSYKNNKNAGTAYVYIKFKGNYKDTKTETLSFSIAAAKLGEEVIAHQVGVAEKKKAQKPVPVLTWADTGKTVSSKYFNISYSPATVKTAGEYTATITPKSGSKNFTGSTTAKVVVTDKAKLLSSAKVTFSPKSYAYTGGEITPGYTLTLGGVTLTEGRDYKRVNLCNNVKPGSAAVIFEGMNGYCGSKTATFRISGRIELDNSSDFTYTYSSSVAYVKGGAKPAVSVKDNKNGVTLTEGTDYTLSYSKNKAVTNGAVIMVKGKGSYKGTVTLYFAITQQSLSALEGNIHAADQFVVKKKLKKPTVTIYDLDGKKLSANRDFTIGAAGTPSGDEKSGTVTVTVYGIGAYTGQATVTYRYIERNANISAARLRSKIADQEYTGNAIKLSYAELTNKLYISGSGTSKNLVPGTDFVIASYSSNIKKGTAKVTIRGIGAYAGTKTLSFKIVQRKVNYAGKLWN